MISIQVWLVIVRDFLGRKSSLDFTFWLISSIIEKRSSSLLPLDDIRLAERLVRLGLPDREADPEIIAGFCEARAG